MLFGYLNMSKTLVCNIERGKKGGEGGNLWLFCLTRCYFYKKECVFVQSVSTILQLIVATSLATTILLSYLLVLSRFQLSAKLVV